MSDRKKTQSVLVGKLRVLTSLQKSERGNRLHLSQRA